MIIALSGLCYTPAGAKCSAGAGKSTVGSRLCAAHGFTTMRLADTLKRFCSEVFDWPLSLLSGPTEGKNAPDQRYPRPDGTYLTPREAMIRLGTEWGRTCYPDVWIDDLCRRLQAQPAGARIVVDDVRFRNELTKLRAAGALLVRITRPVEVLPVETVHPSEVELNEVPDSEFDAVLYGPAFGVPKLQWLTDEMVRALVPAQEAMAS